VWSPLTEVWSPLTEVWSPLTEVWSSLTEGTTVTCENIVCVFWNDYQDVRDILKDLNNKILESFNGNIVHFTLLKSYKI